MCGIAGILFGDPDARAKPVVIQNMCDCMVARGPDEQGLFVEGPLGMGHRRLSIIDLASGQQPMESADGRAVIVYNGELYNYRELKRELEEASVVFRTESDTEVVLNLYLLEGPDFVKRLRGMFAFAIWDRPNRRLVLARDRVGIKPLYFARLPNAFVFGSELKVVMASGLAGDELDLQALDDYFAYGFIRAPRSIFKDVQKLSAGVRLTVTLGDGGRPDVSRYAYGALLPERYAAGMEYNEAKAELERLLQESVSIRLMSEVPLGAFLSGGIDSSTVVWLMSRAQSDPVRTFSIGFREQDYNELVFARAVARRFGTLHEEEIVTPEAVAVLPPVLSAHDEPFGDPSSIPTWYLSRMARKHVTVCLSGDGGDELFAGYTRYRTIERERRVLARIPMIARKVAGLSGALFDLESRARNKLERGALAGPEHYAHFRCNFTPGMRQSLFDPSVVRRVRFDETGELFRDVPRSYWGRDCVSPLQAADLVGYLPDDILVKVDRMSMDHALEARVPLLDHHVVAFTASLPLSFKLKAGRTKRILRDIIEPHMPPEVLTHRKQGFSVPLNRWFRKELKEQLRQVVEGPVFRFSGMFDPRYVRRIYRLHQDGRHDLSWQLWQILIFGRWFEETRSDLRRLADRGRIASTSECQNVSA